MSAPQGYGYPGGPMDPSQASPPWGSNPYGYPGPHAGAQQMPQPMPFHQPPQPDPYPLTRPPTQRPGVIAVAASMSITASLLWMMLVAFGMLLALSIRSSFDTGDQIEGAIYIIADRFLLRMGQGLAVPLFGFPLAAVVAGFLVLGRKPWARIVFSGLGVLSLAWAAWWLHRDLGWWVPLVAYIALASAIPWVPSVGRWLAERPGADRSEPPSGASVVQPSSPHLPPDTPYRAPYGQYHP